MRPLGAGVPVRPQIRRMRGRHFRSAFHLFAWRLLKLESSSTITVENGHFAGP